jgi:hypothetical protein
MLQKKRGLMVGKSPRFFIFRVIQYLEVMVLGMKPVITPIMLRGPLSI